MVKNKKKILFYILFAIAPLFISSFFLMLESHSHNLFTVMPSFSDEDFYFNQIKSILKYGHPLGYYGFDGSHAIIGNFGAHGWFILLPYVIFCKLFGLQFNSMAIMNNMLLCIAIIVYEVLFKPSLKRLILFVMLISSPMIVIYTNTLMVETESYFFAIISALLMVKIVQNSDNKKIQIILTITVIWAMLSKVTWIVLLFPTALIIMKPVRKFHKPVKCILAGGITLLIAGISYWFYHIFTAPYFSGIEVLEASIDMVKTGISYSKVRAVLEIIYDNMVVTFGHYDVKYINISRYYIIIVAILTLAYWVFNKGKDMSFIPAFILWGYIIGILSFYRGGEQAIRNIYPAALFAVVYMYAFSHTNQFRYIIYAVILIFVLSTFVVQLRDGDKGRTWYTKEDDSKYAEAQTFMDHITPLEDADSPWENTLGISLQYYPDGIYELFTPTGIGINYYRELPLENTERPQYFLLPKDAEGVQVLMDRGYTKLDENYKVVILKSLN